MGTRGFVGFVAEGKVWIASRTAAHPGGTTFEPGQQLVVERDGTWRIEDAAVTA
jgi:hypothetical protein